MSRLRIAIVTASALLVAGCSSSGSPSADPTASTSPSTGGSATASASPSTDGSATASAGASTGPTGTATPPAGTAASTLPTGKDNLALAPGTWRSPAGFAPALTVTLPAGWSSVHRGADAFDLGQPDPTKDAPLVAIVFLTPKEKTAADARIGITNRANGNVEPATGAIGGRYADTIDVVGGSGQLIASRAGGIALDAADGQQVRLLTLTVGGAPLVVALLVPQSAQWDAVWPGVEKVLASVKFG